MKILLYCHTPFQLAHGGVQVQIEQTQRALQQAGLEVEPLRWWDANQRGDCLHFFGRIPTGLLRFAQAKGWRVVVADLLGGQGARPPWQLALQSWARRVTRAGLPAFVGERFDWESYRLADACLALTAWEAHLLRSLFGAPAERVHVVPNGVEEVFLESATVARGEWLVCVATISEQKRVLALATAAVAARTPLWVIGRPYAPTDPYSLEFQQLVRDQARWLRYEGPVLDRPGLAAIYRQARGFVLLSQWESLSLSALEAAAAGCPLLLSDLPWAHGAFGTAAAYCPITARTAVTAGHLRQFYDAAPRLAPPPPPPTWGAIGEQLKGIYERL